MFKKHQKLIASIALGALLIAVAGFCYGLIAQASMGDMHLAMAKTVSENCHGSGSQLQKGSPFSSGVLPCCVDRHDNAPSTLTLNFSGITKMVAMESQLASDNVLKIFSDKLIASSDASPPRPDKLSSVLRLE